MFAVNQGTAEDGLVWTEFEQITQSSKLLFKFCESLIQVPTAIIIQV